MDCMDPLARLRNAHERALIPENVYNTIVKRFQVVAISGIDRIEKASGIEYPVAYVEPAAIVSPAPQFGYGVLFARTIPLVIDDNIRVVIQISAPLIAYGLKGTVHAVLAHEFLHYLELERRIYRGIVSDEVTSNMFEGAYADESRTLEPGAVFSDRTLVRHVKKRFGEGFSDDRLKTKVVERWINAGLPRISVNLDTNTINISANTISQAHLPPDMVRVLDKVYTKSQLIRNRRRVY